MPLHTAFEVEYKTGRWANIYKPINTAELRAGAVPVAFCIPGGGYVNADKFVCGLGSSGDDFTYDLTKRGITVISPQYANTTVDGGTVPDAAENALQDMHDLNAWVTANKATYLLDDTQICCVGTSAGGQIALRWVYGDSPPAVSKPTNIVGVFAMSANFTLMDGAAVVIDGDETVVTAGDPVAYQVVGGDDDRFVAADTTAMVNEFSTAGVTLTQHTIAGLGHGDVTTSTVIPGPGITIAKAFEEFLVDQFGL